MSIQAECREAMNQLAESGAVFTEIDVANTASSQAWSGDHFEQAVKHAYNVLQGDFKKGRLVRYGPVNFRGKEDYARRATKIVYADAEKGPEIFDTPNGRFPRLFAESDTLNRAGRRVGTGRDDTKPWDAQTIGKGGSMKGPPVDPGPLLKRIEELTAENARLRKNHPVPTTNGAAVVYDELPDVSVPVALTDLIDLLASRLSEHPRLVEGVKNSVAEALIS